ncbi:MAG: hypothetical protein WCO82_01430 [Sphingomonadales bacterium]
MIYLWLNALPILLATLAGLAMGLVLVRPPGLGPSCLAFASAAWLCGILAGALILAPPKGPVWVMSLGSALVIWAGFVAPVLATSLRLAGKCWGIVGRHAGWWLLMMLVQAAVLRGWGLVAPPG